MPRNAQGVYSLPAGNPVVPGTLIESTWANPTMSDLAAAITGSLPRDGSASMTGPLLLSRNAELPLEAVTKQQVETAINGSNSYLPAGAIQAFAFASVPSGWLECNGGAVSRTTYADLFATIGTTYGTGNGTTTFNVPDLRGEFLRGWDNGRSVDPGRAMGSSQLGANAVHTHGVIDPSHTHASTTTPHTHTLNDPGHVHGIGNNQFSANYSSNAWPFAGNGTNVTSQSKTTGISVNQANVVLNNVAASTGITLQTEGAEARPRNVAMVYAIKAYGALQTDGLGTMAFQNSNAVNIQGGNGIFNGLQCTSAPVNPNEVVRLADIGGVVGVIFSDDPDMIAIDSSTPSAPILRLQSNQPNGVVKLNASGLVPHSLMPMSDINYQGPWDASTGNNPTMAFPLIDWTDGDMFQVAISGTIPVYDTTGVESLTPVDIGDQLVWLEASPVYPSDGWYLNPASSASVVPASTVSMTPTSPLTGTNVQASMDQIATQLLSKWTLGTAFELDLTLSSPVMNLIQRGAGTCMAARQFSTGLVYRGLNAAGTTIFSVDYLGNIIHSGAINGGAATFTSISTSGAANVGALTASTFSLTGDVVQVAEGGTGANNAATARTNLGLGSAATLSVGTAAGNVVQLQTGSKLPAVDGSLLTNLPGSTIPDGSITPTKLSQPLTAMTSKVASGVEVTFPGIPPWAHRITITLAGVSSSAATWNLMARIGNGGALAVTGYNALNCGLGTLPSIAQSANTERICTVGGGGSAAILVTAIVNLIHLGGNLWIADCVANRTTDSTVVNLSGGYIQLAGPLDIVGIVASSGSMDAGTIGVIYE